MATKSCCEPVAWVSTGQHNTGDKGATVWIEMLVAAIGNMKDFDPEKGNWMEYAGQLQHC